MQLTCKIELHGAIVYTLGVLQTALVNLQEKHKLKPEIETEARK
jgi:hypothetical protein